MTVPCRQRKSSPSPGDLPRELITCPKGSTRPGSTKAQQVCPGKQKNEPVRSGTTTAAAVENILPLWATNSPQERLARHIGPRPNGMQTLRRLKRPIPKRVRAEVGDASEAVSRGAEGSFLDLRRCKASRPEMACSGISTNPGARNSCAPAWHGRCFGTIREYQSASDPQIGILSLISSFKVDRLSGHRLSVGARVRH